MPWRCPPELVLAASSPAPADLTARLRAGLDTLRRGRGSGGRSRVSTEPSQETIERARDGDGEAFEVVFRAYGDDVLRVCRRMLGDAEAAADAQADVFLKVRRSFAAYDPGRSLRPWLRSVASHHCIDLLRRRAAEQRVFAVTEGDPGELEGHGASPLSRVLARERRDALERALAALPLEYRLPLLMRYFGDASYDEIAESLDITRARVGTLIFRAKKKLRVHLDEHGEERPG